MSLVQRLNVVTLGVDDLARSKAFFDALGWRAAKDADSYAAYQAGGAIVFLYPMDALAREVPGHPRPGPAFVSMNVDSADAVDAQFAAALKAGAAEVRPPEPQFWGGYSGVFADPNGHYWEIAFNPDWIPGADGVVRI